MSLTTFSHFLYGHRILSNVNDSLDFNEGAGELQATLTPGGYSFSELAEVIETALNAVGANTYVVTTNRDGFNFTISANANFSLLAATGTRVGTGVWDTIGFSAVNVSGANTYTSTAQSGLVYRPQFILQDHVDFSTNIEAIDPSVNESASGEIEVLKFGDRRFMEANIRFTTNITQPNRGPIENNPNGVSDLTAFLEYAVSKSKFEFMANANQPAFYNVVLLEKTPDSRDGTGFTLKELYNKGAPGYFDTGVLTFRKVL